jgi:hypothetical protein
MEVRCALWTPSVQFPTMIRSFRRVRGTTYLQGVSNLMSRRQNAILTYLEWEVGLILCLTKLA